MQVLTTPQVTSPCHILLFENPLPPLVLEGRPLPPPLARPAPELVLSNDKVTSQLEGLFRSGMATMHALFHAILGIQGVQESSPR